MRAPQVLFLWHVDKADPLIGFNNHDIFDQQILDVELYQISKKEYLILAISSQSVFSLRFTHQKQSIDILSECNVPHELSHVTAAKLLPKGQASLSINCVISSNASFSTFDVVQITPEEDSLKIENVKFSTKKQTPQQSAAKEKSNKKGEAMNIEEIPPPRSSAKKVVAEEPVADIVVSDDAAINRFWQHIQGGTPHELQESPEVELQSLLAFLILL